MSHADIADKIVKTELSKYIKTHESQRQIRINHEERLESLLILLGSNENIASAFSSSAIDLHTLDELKYEVGEVIECNLIYVGDL